MKKRMLAMLLCMAMVLSLLPAAALAAEDDVLYVGGTNVIGGGYWKGDGAGGLTAGSENDYTVWYEPDSSSLTLNNAAITKTYRSYEENSGELLAYAIYASGDVNLCLEGSNTIEAEQMSAADAGSESADSMSIIINSYGLYSTGNLIISGTGTCSVDAATIDGAEIQQVSNNGIYADAVTMNSGTIYCSGGRATDLPYDPTQDSPSGNTFCTGLYANQFVLNSGSIFADGGTAKGGIETITKGADIGTVTINGGTFTATGGSASGLGSITSYGLVGSSVITGGSLITQGGNIDAAYYVFGSDEFPSFNSIGILPTHMGTAYSTGCITINSGNFKASSGEITNTVETEKYYCAIEGTSDTITPPAEYWWRTAETDAYTNGADTAFSLVEGQTYVDITTTAPSDNSTSSLYVGGTDVSGGGYWTGDGSGGLTGGTASNYTVRYEPSTSTLTLKDASITKAYTKHTIEETTQYVYDEDWNEYEATGYAETIASYGIYSSSDLTLYLEGTNSITLSSMDASLSEAPNDLAFIDLRLISAGISSSSLTISGTGSCTVTAGSIDCDNAASASSSGIQADRLSMQGGTLESSGGALTGTGIELTKGSGDGYTYGVSTNSLSMRSGTLTGRGGSIAAETWGSSYGFITGNVAVSGGTLAGYGGNGGSSYGLYTNGVLNLSGGNVAGYGGNGKYSSRGIYNSMDNIIMTGGTLKGVSAAGEDSTYFCGICFGSNFCSASLPDPYWWRDSADGSYTSSAEKSCLFEYPDFDGCYHFNRVPYMEVTATNPSSEDSPITGEDNVVPPTTYNVAVLSVGKGTVTVSPKSAVQGDTVTITAAPETGYQLDKLTVTNQNGNSIKLTDQGNGVYTFTMPDSEVFVTVSFTELELPDLVLPFTDVTTSDWFYDAVAYVYDNGLMTGTSATTFSPNATTTRGMIVTILHRLEGSPAADASGFADVESGAWYQEAVDWAAANGIVNGTSETTFAPTSPITREQMAAILYRYAAYKGYDVSQLADLSRFSDSSAVNTYAADALAWANAAGLITGVTDTTLSPQGSAVRAQAATILMRFCENIAQ